MWDVHKKETMIQAISAKKIFLCCSKFFERVGKVKLSIRIRFKKAGNLLFFIYVENFKHFHLHRRTMMLKMPEKIVVIIILREWKNVASSLSLKKLINSMFLNCNKFHSISLIRKFLIEIISQFSVKMQISLKVKNISQF